MMRRVLLVLILGAAGLWLLGAADAAAVQGCAWLDHSGSTVSNRYKVSLEASPAPGVACSAQSGTYKASEGACSTFNAAAVTGGVGSPGNPTGIIVYFFADNVQNSHGNNDGTTNWGTPIKSYGYTSTASFNGASFSFCTTTDGTSGGTAAPGTYRVVIRACSYTTPGPTGCTGTTKTWDVNSDPSGDAAGAGNTIDAETQGGIVAGMAPSSWTDSTTLGGADVSTYVGGEQRHMRLVDKQAIANTGIEAVTLSIIAQGGGSTLNSVSSTTIRTGVNADASFTTPLAMGDSYTNNTSPTKRATITVNSALLGEPWTYFASAPTGATLTSETQLDAAWGLVDKGLRITGTCYIQDPDTATTRPVYYLHRYQTVLSRDCNVQNGRGENLANGAFLRIYRRNVNAEGFSGTLDVASCDTTVGASGAWQCDAQTNGNSGATRGRAFALDIEQFSSSARTTSWAQGTLTGRFDITTINNPSPVGEGDPIYLAASDTTPGSTQTIVVRLAYDNGTARTGAANNVSLYVRAPDSTWAANGVHPTELALPDGSYRGYYTYSLVVSTEGSWLVLANATTDLNEQRSATPVSFQVRTYGIADTLTATEFRSWKTGEFRPARDTLNATKGTVDGIDGNVSSANNTASGALTQAYFNQWRDGEARTFRDDMNNTIEKVNRNVLDVENYTENALLIINTKIGSEANRTRSYLPAQWAQSAAAAWGPRTQEQGALLLATGGILAVGLFQTRWERAARGRWIIAGIVALVGYALALGLQ